MLADMRLLLAALALMVATLASVEATGDRHDHSDAAHGRPVAQAEATGHWTSLGHGGLCHPSAGHAGCSGSAALALPQTIGLAGAKVAVVVRSDTDRAIPNPPLDQPYRPPAREPAFA